MTNRSTSALLSASGCAASGENWAAMGSQHLRWELESVLELFGQGLGQLAQGARPVPDALAVLAAPCLAALMAKQGEPLLLRRRAYARHASAASAARYRLVEAAFFHGWCLQRLDAALMEALSTLAAIMERQDFSAATALVDWCRAVHPHFAALAAVDTANALFRADRASEAARLLSKAKTGDERGAVSGPIGRLLEELLAGCTVQKNGAGASFSCFSGPAPRWLPTGLSPEMRVRAMAAGPGAALFASSFTDDLSIGALQRLDVETGAATVLADKMVVGGLHYDAQEGALLGTVVKSSLCPEPHIVWLDGEGRILRLMETPTLEGGRWLPHFGTMLRRRLFVRDALSKAIVELDAQTAQVLRVHRHPSLTASISFSVVAEKIYIHFMNGAEMMELDPDTGALIPAAGNWPSHVRKIVRDEERGQTYSLSCMRIFDARLPVRAQAVSLRRCCPDGRVDLVRAVASGDCSNPVLLRHAGGLCLYVADSGRIIEHQVGEKS